VLTIDPDQAWDPILTIAIVSDATILLRDMAGDAAEKAASRINPSDEKLSQIDRPAEDNTWHDVPDLSRDNIKNTLKSNYNKQKPVSSDDVKDAAGNATEAAHPSGSRDPADAAALAARDQQEGTNSGIDAQAGAENAAGTLKERASENVPEDTKDKGREAKEKSRNYLKEKFPEERRDQTIWRLKKMVVEIQSHPDYQQAISTLLSLAEQYGGHANHVAQQTAGTVQGAHTDDALKLAEADLKTLIERFANGTSTDDLIDSIDAVYRDADQDPELKNWFKQVDAYIRKCLQQRGYIMEDRANEEWNELYDRGNFLLRDRYRNHTDRIVDEFKFLGDQFDKDPQNKKFGQAVNKLFTDLGNDENGKPTFKPHLIKDLTEVIIPSTLESIAYVPIPRIEYSDSMVDAVIENLVIESDNLFPNIVEFHTTNHHQFGRKGISNKHKMQGTLGVSGVQMDLRDVSYYVKRKQGFPSVTDQGIMDIFLGGTGFSFKAAVSTADKKTRQNFFKVDKVEVDVKNFNIKLKQSHHKLLFNLFKPIMLKVIRPAVQKALEKIIKDKLNEIDALAYSIKLEADRAMQEVQNDPQNAPNIYSRYVSAAQKQLMQGKQKTEQVAADKKANVAMTQHDSIFPNVKLAGGISSKATEYKDLASKGDKWESPIFSLGSASKSSDIPNAAKIRRKEHDVTSGGVRGPQNIGNTSSVTEQSRDPAAQSLGQNGSANSSANPGSAGYANTTGFSNQVDQAFSKNEGNGTAGITNGHTVGNGHTTLGTNNPVYNGSAH
jgi:hypothetical protein